jgi:phosphoglycolate phosphatase
MRLCIFDLDHTLIRSSLDLAAMALDIRRLLEEALGPLPARPDRYRVGELIAYCQAQVPHLEPRVWAVARDHEERAICDASLEPGAAEAVTGSRALGFAPIVWTNNTRSCTAEVLTRFALAPHFDLVVTRDEMAELKPDPAGFRVIQERFPTVTDAVVVGDSWVDGVAAQAAGVPFIAYRANPEELHRHGVVPRARITALPDLLRVL